MSAKIAAIPLLLASSALWAQQPTPDEIKKQLEYTRSHYTKYDYRIPMRDGVKLFTTAYAPKDTSKSYPFVMQRTPYSLNPARNWEPNVTQRLCLKWFEASFSVPR